MACKIVFGKISLFLGNFWEVFGEVLTVKKEGFVLKKKTYKGKCVKRKISKCKDVCRTYSSIEETYVDILEKDESVQEIRCHVLLDGLLEGEYTSDFVCIQTDGEIIVRECVQRGHLTKPMTIKLLDLSREYWMRRGIKDWGVVIDAEQ